MNIRIATKIEDGQMFRVEVRAICWRCPNCDLVEHERLECLLTDERVGERGSEAQSPIPESCPLPSLVDVSRDVSRTVAPSSASTENCQLMATLTPGERRILGKLIIASVREESCSKELSR